jgi:hypothetical protein
MTAHVRYPALDASGAAATLSQPILTTLLRDELGFAGAVASDSLLMEGVKVGCNGEGDLATRALNAGVDILLDVADPLATLDALMAAVAAWRLSVARVDQALARVMRLKELVFDAAAPPAAFAMAENRAQTEAAARDVARRATVVAKNDGGLLPFTAARSLCAIFVNPFPLPSNADPPPLEDLLRRRFPRLSFHELGAAPSVEQLDEAAQAAAAADQVLAAFIVKPAAWHRFGLPPAIGQWLATLAQRRPLAAACLGAPQGLDPLGMAAAQVCTYSDVPASQEALVDALLESTTA